MCAYYNGISIANEKQEPGTPVAGVYPVYEVTTPQYPIPQPYALAQLGYRRNEIVYACINKRMAAISEPPIALYEKAKRKDKSRKALEKHPILDLIAQPNEAMGQVEFWQAAQCYLDIAGFSVWEKEYNRIGEVIHLWPMRPDWCSFRRGDNRPLEYVRYQPWGGIPFIDVPIERCVVFMEFDPIWPMLKGFSRTNAAMRVLGVDNAATDFLKLFFDHGAITNGIIKTKQSLQAAEANRIKQLWREQHGGASNWQDVTVLGSDIDYVPTQMNFKDMGFENIDGRDEARICQVFEIPPIVIGSRVGLDRATYSNYEQAVKAWYTQSIQARWRWLESELTQQLLPDFDAEDLVAEFDTTNVQALQEDRDAKVKRAVEMAKLNLWTRDEARAEVGDDPIDKGTPVFVGITAKAVEPPAVSALVFDPEQDAETLRTEEQQAKEQAANRAANPPPQFGQLPPGQQPPTLPGRLLSDGQQTQVRAGPQLPPPPPPPASDQFNAMVKNYASLRKLALASVGQAVGVPFDDELLACKSREQVRRVFEKHMRPAEPSAAAMVELSAELKAARIALEKSA